MRTCLAVNTLTITGILMPDLKDTVPLPHGKLYPSLRDSYNYNKECTPEWLITLCPNCGSDHTCCLSPKYNPERIWYCISCNESWEYGEDK